MRIGNIKGYETAEGIHHRFNGKYTHLDMLCVDSPASIGRIQLADKRTIRTKEDKLEFLISDGWLGLETYHKSFEMAKKGDVIILTPGFNYTLYPLEDRELDILHFSTPSYGADIGFRILNHEKGKRSTMPHVQGIDYRDIGIIPKLLSPVSVKHLRGGTTKYHNHLHGESEWYLVVKGEGITIGKEKLNVEVKPGDLIYYEKMEPHAIAFADVVEAEQDEFWFLSITIPKINQDTIGKFPFPEVFADKFKEDINKEFKEKD